MRLRADTTVSRLFAVQYRSPMDLSFSDTKFVDATSESHRRFIDAAHPATSDASPPEDLVSLPRRMVRRRKAVAAAMPLDGKLIAAMQGTSSFEYDGDTTLDRDALSGLTGNRPLLSAGNGGSFGRWKLIVQVAVGGGGDEGIAAGKSSTGPLGDQQSQPSSDNVDLEEWTLELCSITS